MIAGAVTLGAPIQNYHQPDHPMQQRVIRTVTETSGLAAEQVHWAIDGCNLPAPALPLSGLALMYAKLADAHDIVPESSSSPEPDHRTLHLSRIHRSMSKYPELIGGEGRFCTELMEAYEGQIVGKVGADACYALAIPASADGQGSERAENGALGIAIKVGDGNLDVLYSSVVEILERLGVGTEEMRRPLSHWHYPKLLNTAGVVIGRMEHRFQLQKVT